MTVSAIRVINNNPHISFGKNDRDKEGHPVIGGVVGAAAGLAAGKYMPVVDFKTISYDTFNKAQEHLSKSANGEEEKAAVKISKEFFAERKNRMEELLSSFGFDKSAQEITLGDYLSKNINEGQQRYQLAKTKIPVNDPNFEQFKNTLNLADFSKSELKSEWLLEEKKYLEGLLRGLREGTGKDLADYTTKEEALKGLPKDIENKQFLYDITKKIKNGKLTRTEAVEIIKEIIKTEIDEGLGSNKETITKIAEKMNAKKLYILGAIGLVAGAIIGQLVKTKTAEDGES